MATVATVATVAAVATMASVAELDAQIQALLVAPPTASSPTATRLRAIEARVKVLEDRVELTLDAFGREAEARIADAALAAADSVRRQLLR